MILEGAQAALALAPIAFVGGFIQGLTGFGSALVTIPLATFFVPLPFALAVFAIVDFASDAKVLLHSVAPTPAEKERAWSPTPDTVTNGTGNRLLKFESAGDCQFRRIGIK